MHRIRRFASVAAETGNQNAKAGEILRAKTMGAQDDDKSEGSGCYEGKGSDFD
jgi:hypothetical protein